MLKINLLPPYVREKKRIMWTIVMMAPILLIVVGVMFWWWSNINGEIREIVDMRNRIEPDAAEAERLQQEIARVNTENQDLFNIVTFIKNVNTYNDQLVDLLELVTSWTYEKVQLKGLVLSGPGNSFNRVDMACVTDTYESMYASWNNLWNAADLFSQVTPSDLTPAISFPEGQEGARGGTRQPYGGPFGQGIGGPAEVFGTAQEGISFKLAFTLRQPLEIPDYGGAAVETGGAGGMGPSGYGTGGPLPPPSAGAGGQAGPSAGPAVGGAGM